MRPQPRNVLVRESLVRSMASGEAVAAWCRRTGTPRSTASKWQADPAFHQDLERLRKALLNDGMGDLIRRVTILEQQLRPRGQIR